MWQQYSREVRTSTGPITVAAPDRGTVDGREVANRTPDEHADAHRTPVRSQPELVLSGVSSAAFIAPKHATAPHPEGAGLL